MSLSNTTLSSALAVTQSKIVVASATGFAAGRRVRIDGELFKVTSAYDGSSTTVPVVGGQEGTIRKAHPVTATVTVGAFSDSEWGSQAPQTDVQYPVGGRATTIDSYSADGAITLPDPGSDKIVYLNSTVALAMTLAAPKYSHNGSSIRIHANGKATHTVDVDATNGVGNAGSSYDRLTFLAGGTVGVILTAINGFWNAQQIGATNTNIVPTIG